MEEPSFSKTSLTLSETGLYVVVRSLKDADLLKTARDLLPSHSNAFCSKIETIFIDCMSNETVFVLRNSEICVFLKTLHQEGKKLFVLDEAGTEKFVKVAQAKAASVFGKRERKRQDPLFEAASHAAAALSLTRNSVQGRVPNELIQIIDDALSKSEKAGVVPAKIDSAFKSAT